MDLSLPSDVKVEEEKDVLGSGGVLDSGVYKGTVEMCYIDASDKGSKRINIHFKDGSRVTKFTTYISNQSGGFTYAKNGENLTLPGYQQMDSFFKTLTGKSLAENARNVETKSVKIYDFNAKAEIATEVSVFMGALDKAIAIGILHISKEKEKDSKTKLPNGKPKYVGTNEFRDINEFKKYFDADTGLTYAEKQGEATKPEFLTKWKEKFDGKTIVEKAKHHETEAEAAESAKASEEETDSLFD